MTDEIEAGDFVELIVREGGCCLVFENVRIVITVAAWMALRYTLDD